MDVGLRAVALNTMSVQTENQYQVIFLQSPFSAICILQSQKGSHNILQN